MTLQIHSRLERIKRALTGTRHTHTSQSHSQVTPIDPDDALTMLNSPRRRLAIEALADASNDAAMTVSDLAETVAATENDCTVDELTSEQRKRVYIALIQQHLRAIAPLIEYDENEKLATPTPALDRLWKAYQSFESALNQ